MDYEDVYPDDENQDEENQAGGTKHSKKAWLISTFVLLVAVLMASWLIFSQNEKLTREIEQGVADQDSLDTVKVLRDMGEKLVEMAEQIEKQEEGDDSPWVSTEGIRLNNFTYSFEYPRGWHVAHLQGVVHVNDQPLTFGGFEGSGGNIQLSLADLGKRDEDDLQEAATAIREELKETLREVTEEKFFSEGGAVVYKVIGLGPEYGAGPEGPHTIPVVHFFVEYENFLRSFALLTGNIVNAVVLEKSEFNLYADALDHMMHSFVPHDTSE